MTTFYYMSGEEVREGDIITSHGERAVIEGVFSKGTEDARAWCCFETGGVMIKEEGGALVLCYTLHDEEDIEFLGRANVHG